MVAIPFGDKTLIDVLRQSQRLFGPNVFMRRFKEDRFVDITYNEFADRVSNIGRGLLALGLQKGDRVAILSENRPEWGMAFFATYIAGGVNIPLDALLKISAWIHIIRNSEAKALIVSRNFLSEIENIRVDLPELKHIICIDDLSGKQDSLSSAEIEKLGQKYSGSIPELIPSDLASIIYTSGTMGQSKGVMLSHCNITSDMSGAVSLLPILKSDNFLSILPLHHTFECTCGLLIPFSVGARITYARGMASKLIIEDIKNNKATILLGVPLLFEKMYAGITKAISNQPIAKRALFKISFSICHLLSGAVGINAGKIIFHGLREKAGMSSIRMMLCGGAPTPPEIAKAFNLLGFAFRQGYGLSECSPILTLNPLDHYRDSSIGKPIVGAELKIVDQDSRGIGQIMARGPMVMQGYYNNPEATCEVLKDGWLYTGDSGWVDADGFYYITGRVKNVIVTQAGKNVYPEEIEYELNKSPYILESLVLGRSLEGTRGEEIEAIIVPDYEYFDSLATEKGVRVSTEGIEKTIKAEVHKLSSGLAEFKKVKYIQIRQEEFEKTSTRKIKRYLFNKKSEPINRTGRNESTPRKGRII
jgi:long-chain acyl-CoA synthetase